MWDQVSQLYAYHGMSPAEMRLLKLTEDVGEVAEVFIGMQGLNARKGMSGISGDVDEARSSLERCLAAVTPRAGL